MRGMRELDATLFIGGPPSIQSSSRWDSRRCGKEREGPRGGLGRRGGRGEYTPISERFIIETARRGGESEGSIAFFFRLFFFPFRGRNPDAYVFVA